MTLTRALLIALLILGITFAVFAFGNPQWHKQVYMFQAYIWPSQVNASMVGFSGFDGNRKDFHQTLSIPKSFSGEWTVWDENGNWVERYAVIKGKPKVDQSFWKYKNYIYGRTGSNPFTVYDFENGIDRRSEFRIPLE